ncbi:hypothetical protein BMS3Abin04_01596 [bacterium BMS3Abin04]|nr:hypothetical protein BMS3Abin04_01596 [bacterium BMS3Abin04]
MNYKIYLRILLSKIIDFTLAIIIGVFSYYMFVAEKPLSISISIYEWNYLIYVLNTFLSILIFRDRTIGTILLKLKIDKKNTKKFVLRELVLIFILNLLFYNYGFITLIIFLPIKNKNGEVSMLLDYVFNLKFIQTRN